MIKARVGEFERNRRHPKHVLNRTGGGAIGARSVAHPKHVPCAVPDAIAGPLEHEPVGKRLDHLDQTALTQLFIIYFGLSDLGIEIPPVPAAIIGLGMFVSRK